MRYIIMFFFWFWSISCTQNTTPLMQEEGTTLKFQAQDSLMHIAGLPINRIERQNWVAQRNYQDADRLIQSFLSTYATKLSGEQTESFNRASSYFILGDMGLMKTSNHTMINKYLTSYFKAGGSDALLVWEGMQIAKRNAYWDAKAESEANWFINGLVDARILDFSQDIKKNEVLIAQKPSLKVLLKADNDKMAELIEEYKAIKIQVANLPQCQPISKKMFMESVNQVVRNS